MNPRCILACLKDGQCEMYFGVISKRYDPNTFTGAKESKGICFSRWFFEKDWTLTIKALTHSAHFSNQLTGIRAMDGIYLQGNTFLFNSIDQGAESLNPWILVELEEAKVIKTILVLTRSFKNKFKNILVEIGMSLTSMKTFDTYGPTQAPDNEVIEFKGKSMKAKFIRFTKTSEVILIIAELAILGI